jgi:hypothetical protein
LTIQYPSYSDAEADLITVSSPPTFSFVTFSNPTFTINPSIADSPGPYTVTLSLDDGIN